MKPQQHPIRLGKPKWLRRKLPTGPEYEQVRKLLKDSCLTTVCQEAQCPNQFECYSKGTATFMILGEKCTRNCAFCAVSHGPDTPPDESEPERVADAVRQMGLKYSVITSVTRDDLEDGGASFFIRTVKAIREASPETLIEILIPDLAGNWPALKEIAACSPDVLNHNIETVRRLYNVVRPQAVYERSLELIGMVKKFAPRMVTKSGIMVGLGETRTEITATLKDLAKVKCDIVTLGQYLQPSRQHLPVTEFITPDQFAEFEQEAIALGFTGVAAGPSVRSSYEAGVLYRRVKERMIS